MVERRSATEWPVHIWSRAPARSWLKTQSSTVKRHAPKGLQPKTSPRCAVTREERSASEPENAIITYTGNCGGVVAVPLCSTPAAVGARAALFPWKEEDSIETVAASALSSPIPIHDTITHAARSRMRRA